MRFSDFMRFSDSNRYLPRIRTRKVASLLLSALCAACGATESTASEIVISADSSDPIVLTDPTTLTVAEGGSYTLSGEISGAFALTKGGVGSLRFSGNNTFSQGLTITNGSLYASAPSGNALASSAFKPLGSGTISIADSGKLIWNFTSSNTSSNACDLTNTISGTGILRMEMGTGHGNSNFAINSRLSEFTGTLELGGNTRVEWSGDVTNLNKVSTIVIESGSEFWTAGGLNTFESDFILNGTGAGAGGDSAQRGAIRLGATTVFNGSFTLAADSLFGIATNVTANLNSDVTLNGHTLFVANSVSTGGALVLSGNVSAGTIENRYNLYATGMSGTSTHALKFATSAEAAFAKDQTIEATILQNNTSTAMVFDPATGKTITANGVISGAGAITKDGEGTLVLGALNTFSGGLTINDGLVTLKDDADGTSITITTRTYQAGTGTITINENGTFHWFNQYNTDSLPNTIQGTGTLILTAAHSITNNYGSNYGINSKLTDFTGTLELQGHARAATSSVGGTTKVIIGSGSQLWLSNGTLAADLVLNGDGTGAGGDGTGRGAVAVNGTSTLTGTTTLASDAYIGLRDYNPTLNLQGDIETAGHTLAFSQNYQSGGTYNLTGNVTSTGGTLGKIDFRGVGTGNAYAANIGNAAAAESPVTQQIAANLNYSNATNPLNFLTGENRTIEISGILSGSGNIVKTGAGTLTVNDSSTITGTLTVNGGTVNWGATTFNNDTTQLGFTSGITSLTVTDGATVNLNTANRSLATLNLTSGTVHANYVFRTIGTPAVNFAGDAAITVGSEAGETALLDLNCTKALGDHSGTVTIYDGGTINIGGGDISMANSKGITFVGGGAITSKNNNVYFNFRGNGNQCLKVEGANAEATIDSQIFLYDNGIGKVNIVEADSSLTISKSIMAGHDYDFGIIKQGAGTLILSASNQFPQLQIEEGTVKFTGSGNLSPKGGSAYTVDVTIADGAKLVLDSACNFSSTGSTFTMAPGATLIVDRDGWNLTPTIENALVAGTTLGGSGRIVGNIDATGLTIAPGNNSIGTLTIDGSLTLDPSSLINLEVGSSTMNDELIILDDLNLTSGITLKLTNTSGLNDIQFGDTVTLLTANNLEEVWEDVNVVSDFNFNYANGQWGIMFENGSLIAVAGDASSLPEPAAWLLLALGTLGVVMLRKRDRVHD